MSNSLPDLLSLTYAKNERVNSFFHPSPKTLIASIWSRNQIALKHWPTPDQKYKQSQQLFNSHTSKFYSPIIVACVNLALFKVHTYSHMKICLLWHLKTHLLILCLILCSCYPLSLSLSLSLSFSLSLFLSFPPPI